MKFAIVPALIAATAAHALCPTPSARAADITYHPVAHPDGSPGVVFESGYSLGVHRGQARALAGVAQVTLAPFAIQGARFSVPIESMTTGNAQRDCHLREALGLDYARPGSTSRFPANHVCNGANEIPAGAGDDSVVFPEIQAELLSVQLTSGGPDLAPGKPIDLEAKIRWTIHGVIQERALQAHAELLDAQKRTQRVQGAGQAVHGAGDRKGSLSYHAGPAA
jgi:hypothetical protein